jgi:hypothetical protein
LYCPLSVRPFVRPLKRYMLCLPNIWLLGCTYTKDVHIIRIFIFLNFHQNYRLLKSVHFVKFCIYACVLSARMLILILFLTNVLFFMNYSTLKPVQTKLSLKVTFYPVHVLCKQSNCIVWIKFCCILSLTKI